MHIHAHTHNINTAGRLYKPVMQVVTEYRNRLRTNISELTSHSKYNYWTNNKKT